MDFTEHLPLLSLIVIPAVGWLHRQLTKLAQESIEQETAIDGLKLSFMGEVNADPPYLPDYT
jgi:hypothetical protein